MAAAALPRRDAPAMSEDALAPTDQLAAELRGAAGLGARREPGQAQVSLKEWGSAMHVSQLQLQGLPQNRRRRRPPLVLVRASGRHKIIMRTNNPTASASRPRFPLETANDRKPPLKMRRRR
jgi:hypothetical protein